MHGHSRRSGAVALLVVFAALVPAACARDDSSIFIRGCLVGSRTDCTYQLSLTTPLLLEGVVDPAYASGYSCVVMFENQIVPRGNPSTLQTETSGVQLYEAEVQVLDPVAGGAIKQFSVPVSGFADPGMAGMPGLGAAEVLMVDADTAANKTGEVVASVIIKGRTLGGLEVHTQEFLYPITILPPGSTCSRPSSATSCASTASSSATADCRLGLDEPGGTNCQLIAASNPCGRLECPVDTMGKSDLTQAQCPVHSPPDNSCCNP